jgi:hypothetical protein
MDDSLITCICGWIVRFHELLEDKALRHLPEIEKTLAGKEPADIASRRMCLQMTSS